MIEVRRLAQGDQAAVLSLNAQAQPALALLDRSEFARLMDLSQAHLALADSRGAVLGYALVFAGATAYDGEEFQAIRHRIGASMLYVDQLAIAAAARGQGFGRLLYRHIALAARARDLRWICCEVNTAPPNPASLQFHRRLGFAEIGALATRDGREVVLLSRQVRDD